MRSPGPWTGSRATSGAPCRGETPPCAPWMRRSEPGAMTRRRDPQDARSTAPRHRPGTDPVGLNRQLCSAGVHPLRRPGARLRRSPGLPDQRMPEHRSTGLLVAATSRTAGSVRDVTWQNEPNSDVSRALPSTANAVLLGVAPLGRRGPDMHRMYMIRWPGVVAPVPTWNRSSSTGRSGGAGGVDREHETARAGTAVELAPPCAAHEHVAALAALEDVVAGAALRMACIAGKRRPCPPAAPSPARRRGSPE